MRDISLLGGEILASVEGFCAVEFDERKKRKWFSGNGEVCNNVGCIRSFKNGGDIHNLACFYQIFRVLFNTHFWIQIQKSLQKIKMYHIQQAFG
jgi:hypothetical protein